MPNWRLAYSLPAFEALLDDDKLVGGMIHVRSCESPQCREVGAQVIDFLSSNRSYTLMMLRALSKCRAEARAFRERVARRAAPGDDS